MSFITLRTVDGIDLEGRVRRPVGAACGVALLLHPHPAFGGHMDVWILPAVAEALAAAGWVSLRLNFRGVGGSTGAGTAGVEEQADAEAGLAHLRALEPDLPTAVVGWSFGAAIGLRLGEAVDHWVGIAPPSGPHPDVPLHGPVIPDVPPRRRDVVVGSEEQFWPPSTLGKLLPDRVVVIEGADHFLFDRDPEVAAAVASLLTDRAPVLPLPDTAGAVAR